MGLKTLQKDLKNGMSLEEGLKKHNMTLKEIFNPKPKKTSERKGSVKKNGFSNHYGVSKMINGKIHWYGTYFTKEDAERVREELYKVNWDKSELDNILKETGIQRVQQTDRKINKDTYIYPTRHNSYKLAKWTIKNGKKGAIGGGTYKTIEEARIIRDELIQNNWDITCLDELCKKHNIIRRNNKGNRK